nr:unnamed protein product [Digitaria exilis]
MPRSMAVAAAALVVLAALHTSAAAEIQRREVSYDGRALIVDGTRRMLFSGEMHYTRSTPEMWPTLIAKAKEGGLDVIQTYVFWNVHEPVKGQITVITCIWKMQEHMQRFVTQIVNMMKHEGLYYAQGGPIIISQIENEYQMVERAFGSSGSSYVPWAAAMAINSCNGLTCGETFGGPNSPNKPALWTENWTSRFLTYGSDTQLRSPEDIAFAVALFIARKKGSFVNYYMVHVFETESNCVAFLVNFDNSQMSSVTFRHISFQLAPKSISILSDCRRVVYETAKINAQHGSRTALVVQSLSDIDTWKAFKEPIPLYVKKAMYTTSQLLEQLSATKDETDYLWYTVSHEYRSSGDGQLVLLNVRSVHGSHDEGDNIILKMHISLKEGQNTISLLNVMVGSPASSTDLKDSGAHMERRVFGIRKVTIQKGKQTQLLNNRLWGYQVGLFAERNYIYTQGGSRNIEWATINDTAYHPLTWYKATFATPAGNDPVALNLVGMGKGEVWINGESIGRYWVSLEAPSSNPSQSFSIHWHIVPKVAAPPRFRMKGALFARPSNVRAHRCVRCHPEMA